MKALTHDYLETLSAEEMLICCNCAYVDTKISIIGRCPGDREYICPNCGSKAFLVFSSASQNLIGERVAVLEQDNEEEE